MKRGVIGTRVHRLLQPSQNRFFAFFFLKQIATLFAENSNQEEKKYSSGWSVKKPKETVFSIWDWETLLLC